MEPLSKINQQRNEYDRIIKENMPKIIPDLFSNLLALDIRQYQEVPTKIQYVKEREADLVCDVLDAKGNRYILHLEYQTTNDPLMLYRMAEYSIMLQRKFKLPVEQYVVYTGHRKMSMKNTIQIKDMNYRYNLISTSDLLPEVFLNATSTEMKTQVVWSRLTKEQAEHSINMLLKDIANLELGELERKKLLEQLHYFCKLRNFENLLNTAMNNVRLTRKQIETDPFWIQGMEKGISQGITQGIEIGVTETAKSMKAEGYNNEQIAKITKLSPKEIEKL